MTNSPCRCAGITIASLHRYGNEQAWWANVSIEPLEAAQRSVGRDAWREGDQGQGRGRCSRSGNIMNRSARSLSVPAELMFLMEQSCLLPGENRRDFEALRLMMIEEIRPETKIEWLWLLDLVERSWEILPYRRLKQRMLDAFREAAIACILHRINSVGGNVRTGSAAQHPGSGRMERTPRCSGRDRCQEWF